MPISPNTTLGRYTIISQLGAGGMGAVYLAHDNELDRQVALKVLLPEVAENEDRLRRFVQEAKAASALNHPNILTVYDIGNVENTRFIATELVKGHTLHHRLHDEPLTLRETLEIALQVAAALSAAHGAGIVHRDIKPDNIMLRDDGLVKVLDFGLAKLTDPKDAVTGPEDATRKVLTNPGVVMGTVLYMSPEQARGKPVDGRSDVWSLGVVLYEMLAGQTPFAGETMNDSIAAILAKDPAPLPADTPSELQRIIRKSLQKNTGERYQTVKDLQLDLKNIKRELEFSEEMERTQQQLPAFASSAQARDSATAAPATPLSTQSSHPRSSAEYIVSGIRSHKIATLAVLALVVAISAGAGYWFIKNRSAGTEQINSIAVLPFDNRSGNPDSEYLSDGLAESLIYRLSQVPNLKVSPTSAVFRYKGKNVDVQKIAEELNVDAVMSGRVVERGDSFDISVELIDARKNRLLWGERFERKTSELMATQREIATAISQKLQLKLSGNQSQGLTKRYTNDNQAYQHYLKGRFYWNKRTGESIESAIEEFRAAVEKDPAFALAYTGLADSYAVAATYAGRKASETLPLARSNALRAIELDNTLAEPHATLGIVNHFEWKFKEAEAEYKRAIELNPNYATTHHWYSRLLRSLGRMDEAWVEINRASEIDPLSFGFLNNIAEIHVERGDLKSAAGVCQKVLDLDPNFWAAHHTLAVVLLKQGHTQEAMVEAQRSRELVDSPAAAALVAFIYGRLGRKAEVEALIKQLKEQKADARHVAVAYAGLDDRDQVFAWLEKAYADHSHFLAILRLEWLLDPLKSDPRWIDLERRVGIS